MKPCYLVFEGFKVCPFSLKSDRLTSVSLLMASLHLCSAPSFCSWRRIKCILGTIALVRANSHLFGTPLLGKIQWMHGRHRSPSWNYFWGYANNFWVLAKPNIPPYLPGTCPMKFLQRTKRFSALFIESALFNRSRRIEVLEGGITPTIVEIEVFQTSGEGARLYCSGAGYGRRLSQSPWQESYSQAAFQSFFSHGFL